MEHGKIFMQDGLTYVQLALPGKYGCQLDRDWTFEEIHAIVIINLMQALPLEWILPAFLEFEKWF